MAEDIQNQILQELLQNKLISKEQLNDIKTENKKTGKDIEKIVLDNRLANEDELFEIKGKVLGLPFIDLSEKMDIDPTILNLIPQRVAENYQMVAFEKEAKELKVGLVDPQNFKAIEAAEFVAKENGLKNRYFLISLTGFNSALRRYEPVTEEIKRVLEGVQDKIIEDLKKESLSPAVGKEGLEEVIKHAPISKIVATIIKHAVISKASDIHIEPVKNNTRVRLRIDGILHTFLNLPVYIHSAVVARIKVLANLKLDETRIPQDGRIRMTIDEQEIDLRISTLPLSGNEKVVMRILVSSGGVISLKELGFRDRFVEIIEKNIKKTQGLFLLTGPTGSGKTTTLHTILTMLNREGVNIITLEDPVEYYIDGINQSQINPVVGLTFATGLRAILRQDPNIIMVGEIRDRETAELAIHASLTGHAVYSTLHTNDALKALPRLIDMGAQPFLIASTVGMVVAQRLARKICPECKQEMKILPELEKLVRDQLANLPAGITTPDINEALKASKPLKFFKGKGCLHCGESGYKGRIVISEVIDINSEMAEIIIKGCPLKELSEAAKKSGFISFKEDGLLKCLEGLTTIEEVLRVGEM